MVRLCGVSRTGSLYFGEAGRCSALPVTSIDSIFCALSGPGYSSAQADEDRPRPMAIAEDSSWRLGLVTAADMMDSLDVPVADGDAGRRVRWQRNHQVISQMRMNRITFQSVNTSLWLGRLIESMTAGIAIRVPFADECRHPVRNGSSPGSGGQRRRFWPRTGERRAV